VHHGLGPGPQHTTPSAGSQHVDKYTVDLGAAVIPRAGSIYSQTCTESFIGESWFQQQGFGIKSPFWTGHDGSGPCKLGPDTVIQGRLPGAFECKLRVLVWMQREGTEKAGIGSA
jgi:hypothetical protein